MFVDLKVYVTVWTQTPNRGRSNRLPPILKNEHSRFFFPGARVRGVACRRLALNSPKTYSGELGASSLNKRSAFECAPEFHDRVLPGRAANSLWPQGPFFFVAARHQSEPPTPNLIHLWTLPWYGWVSFSLRKQPLPSDGGMLRRSRYIQIFL